MNRSFDLTLAQSYKSPSQKIRILSESWTKNEIFCPHCGNTFRQYENNAPVADFFCNCGEDFELKSKKNTMGQKIVDGAYETMIQRLKSENNPNFFFLNYNQDSYEVLNFVVIPKHFFIPEIIEKRTPLSQTAVRAGWTGCNILLQGIPRSGKIFYIQNQEVNEKEEIMKQWQKTLFLRDFKTKDLKGWILDTLKCIERLKKETFSLQEMYQFENFLSQKHPRNRYVKDKIRQQLQFLRDRDYLEFIDRGMYRLK